MPVQLSSRMEPPWSFTHDTTLADSEMLKLPRLSPPQDRPDLDGVVRMHEGPKSGHGGNILHGTAAL